MLVPDERTTQKAAQIERNAGPRPGLDLDGIPADRPDGLAGYVRTDEPGAGPSG